jgi:hypothetical protein
VVIGPTSMAVTHSAGSDAVRSLSSQTGIVLSGGTLALATASSIDGSLDLTGGRLDGPGDLTVSGLLTWTGGTMAGGSRTAANGGMLVAGNADKVLNDRTLDNAGTATWTGGDIMLGAEAFWNNLADSVLDIRTDHSFVSQGGFGSSGFITNAGTVRKSAGTGVSAFGVYLRFDSAGTVDVASGTLSIEGGGAGSGQFTTEQGGTLRLGQIPNTLPSYQFTASSGITGAGDVIFNETQTAVAGSYEISGRTVVTGTMSFAQDAFTGTLTLGATNASGGIVGPGDLTVTGLLTWLGGYMAGSGRTLALGGMLITGSRDKFVGRIVENAATATWTGGNIDGQVPGTIVNDAGATFDIQANLGYLSSIYTSINNAGLLVRSSGTGAITLGGQFTNTGTVEIDSGTFLMAVNGSSAGAVEVAAGATLSVGGSVYGTTTYTFAAGSTVEGPGTVTFAQGTGSGAMTTEQLLGAYNVGNTVVTGGTVNFFGHATTGTMTLSGGTLGGSGTVTVTGLLTWTGGDMRDAGRTVAGGGLVLSGGSTKSLLFARVLDNAATATWTGGGIFTTLGVVNNLVGATFDVRTDADFGFGAFNNAGTFTKSAGGGTTTFYEFDNTGSVFVQSGTLVFPYALTCSGSVSLAAGTTLTLGSAGNTFTSSSRVDGPGGVNFFCQDFEVAGAYDVQGLTRVNGSVNFTSDVTMGSLRMDSGHLTGVGNVTVTGDLTWAGGEMSGVGHTIANGTLHLFLIALTGGRTLDNAGTATVTSSNFSGGDGVVNNFAGATWEAPVDTGSNGWFVQTFNNAGTFRKLGSGSLAANGDFTNTGVVVVQGGTLSFFGTATSRGQFTLAAGTLLAFTNGRHTLAPGSSVTGAGSVVVGSATLNVAGTYAITGTTSITGNGTVNFLNDVSLTSLAVGGGTFDAWATATVAGSFTWTGGKLTGPGPIFALAGLTVSGDAAKALDGTTLVNTASLTWTGAGGITASNGATLVNAAGAILDAQSDAGLTRTGTGDVPAFLNAGTFRKSAGSGVTTIGVVILNTGTVAIETGTVDLTGAFGNFSGTTLTGGTFLIAGTLRFTNADIRTNAANIVLDGAGSRIVNQSNADALTNFATNAEASSFTLRHGRNFTTGAGFNNAGHLTLGPGSTLSVTGSYTQAGTGTLEVQIGGSPASGLFGRLDVSAVANLNGTLAVTLIGYTPTSGDTYAVLTFGSRNESDFATGPAGFDRNYDDDNGVLALVAR